MIVGITLTAAALALGGGTAAFLRRKRAQSGSSGFKRRRPLSSSEQTLYWRLVKMLPEYTVLPQMPVTRCVVVKGPALQMLRNERVDYVICNHAMQIVAVIDLVSDDEPTVFQARQAKLKEDAFEATGIQLIRWSSASVPSEAYIAMELNQCSWFQTKLAA